MAEGSTISWLAQMAEEAGRADGNVLVFTIIGALGIAGALVNDWTWEAQDIEGLPQVRDDSGRRFPYKLLAGGRHVAIFLPTGRRVEHRITPMAATTPQQLQAEVFAIIIDNYPATT
jgi:hypothetical protein